MASINRGDNTKAFGGDFLRIYLNNPNKLVITKAIFQVNGCLEKEFIDPIFPLRVNFTGEDTYKLQQMNVCKLALWDSHGRRRTADGKFTFFVKENMIKEQDNPDDYDEPEVEDNSITFDLEDPEFLAKFEMNVAPSKMSELEQDIFLFNGTNIKPGANISVTQDGNDVIVSADLEETGSYPDLTDKPSINGIELVGDITIETAINADWDETNPENKSYILNKPKLADIAITGSYKDLKDIPEDVECPTKLSQLENDVPYVPQAALNNYYNKNQVNALIDNIEPDLTEINNEITNINSKINTLNTSVSQKLNKQDAYDLLDEKANIVDVNNELQELDDKKVNLNQLGTGKLNIFVNGTKLNEFSANSTKDVSLEIDVPTKNSQLQNDNHYVTSDFVSFELNELKEEIQDKLDGKIDGESVGDGQLLIRRNGTTIGKFSANSDLNVVADIAVPQNLSELNNDSNYVTQDNLNPIQENLDALQADFNTIPQQLENIQEEIDGKVDKEEGKGLISQAEIERISTIKAYDDTAVKDLINLNAQNIAKNTTTLNSKVDKVVGKQLSTNDFTIEDKANLDNVVDQVSDIQAVLSGHAVETNNIKENISTLQTETVALTTDLQHEEINRQDADLFLQEQIDGLAARSMVVDIVPDLDALYAYDITTLENKDIIAVLMDDSQKETMTYYRFMDGQFIFIGSEGEKYTKAQADQKFVTKATTINGFPLVSDINLTYVSVDAMPASRVIGNGRLTIQRNTVELGVFDADQVDNKTINIHVPEKISELNMDIDYVEQEQFLVETDKLQSNINELALETQNNSTQIDSLKSIISGEDSTLPEVALSGDYNDLINKPIIPSKVSQLENDSEYITQDALDITMDDLVTTDDLPTKISQLENDRGYVTTSSVGKATLTFTINGNPIELVDVKTGITEESWMANENENKTIDIPVDTELKDSTLPVENRVIKAALEGLDGAAVHLTGNQNITGVKTFSDITVENVTITNGTSTTVATNDNSKNIATTAYVKNQDYCTNTNAVHKAGVETITGDKTFNGKVILNGETTGVTQIETDNSKKVATTEFVKSLDYCRNADAVHKTGNETVQGDKTFNDTVDMNGIVYLSKYAHVPTPDLTDETNNDVDLVANVEFVQTSILELNTALQNLISQTEQTLQGSIDDVASNLSSSSGTTTSQINSINSQISTLNSNLNSTNTTVTSNTNRISALETKTGTLETNLGTTNTNVTNLTSTVNTLSSNLTTLTNNFNTFKTSVESRLTSIEARLTALENPEEVTE